MERAIYGLAMPFSDAYTDKYDLLTNTLTIDITNKDSVELDSLVGATIAHDYTQELGRTDKDSLFISINDRGLFFKIIPKTPLALSTYKKVKRGLIKYCSISYAVKEFKRLASNEQQLKQLCKLIDPESQIRYREYQRIIVFEVCVCNAPANEATFCTTDPNHPLLKEVKWDDAKPTDNHSKVPS